jgi:hypothetical protein
MDDAFILFSRFNNVYGFSRYLLTVVMLFAHHKILFYYEKFLVHNVHDNESQACSNQYQWTTDFIYYK